MFTRKGRYVVTRLPGGVVIGSATTLLDAADLAMEDSRRGPGKYLIEQPPVEVDVSKAYGVQPFVVAAPPEIPGELFILDVGVTDASAECGFVMGATAYQWYLNGVPYQVTATPSVYISGLSAETAYTVQVAALRDGVSSAVSSPASFTTAALEPPVWQSVPAQALTVGVVFDVDLAGYVSSPGGDTPSLSVVSGALPAGLSIVGARITGTPTTVETQTPVIRATAVGGTADSAAITFESLNADTTAPDAPTNFAATPYSLTQVRLSWTNPADDATVAGERKSGFLGIDVYRDGVKIDRVLATAATPEEYLAETTVTALWKVRSVDQAFNKGAFTPEISAGPLAQSTAPGVPVSVAAARNSSTSATVTWAAGSGPAPTSYQVWMALSLTGTYSQVATVAGTSHTQTTGFTGSQTPYFYVVAERNGELSAASAKASADAGTLGRVDEFGFEKTTYQITDPSAPGYATEQPTYSVGSLTNNAGTTELAWYQWGGPNAFGSYDAFDHTGADPDRQCYTTASPIRYDAGGVGRAQRMRLTFHTGAEDFPTTNNRYYDNAVWHRKGGWNAGDAGSPDERAHRNEVAMTANRHICPMFSDVWIGASFLIPIAGNPWGDSPNLPNSFWAGWRHLMQLHPKTGGRNPVITVSLNGGWRGMRSALDIPHPANGPIVVAYMRGSDLYGTLSQLPAKTSAEHFRCEWVAPVGGPAVSRYRVFRSVRPTGEFHAVGQDITAGVASSQTGIATGSSTTAHMGGVIHNGQFRAYYGEIDLGASSGGIWTSTYVYLRPVYADNSLGPASLISPAPREYLQIAGRSYDCPPNSCCPQTQQCTPDQVLCCPMFGDPVFAYTLPGMNLAALGNHWTDVVMNFRMSPRDNTGYLQVWVNDEEKLYVAPIPIGEYLLEPGWPNGQHYWRAGMYHGLLSATPSSENVPPDWPKRTTIYFDEFKQVVKSGGNVGQKDVLDSGYQAVKPRGVRT